MVSYKIEVRDNNGDVLGRFTTYRNLEFNKRLNNYGSCSFDILANDTKASSLVALRRYQVFIYRVENGEETLVWAGEQAMREGKLNTQKTNWVTIHCYDWLEQLNHRYTADEVTFTAEDAGQIAWSLIDTTQSDTDGDMGITEGTIEVTVDRDRTYFNQNIMEAIINLANVISGFDFEINDQKIFNVYGVKGEDKSDSIILKYGKNLTDCHIIDDFTQPGNRAIVLGEATGEDNLQRIERNDTDSQGNYGLREKLISEMDVSEIETLEDKGDAVLRKYATSLIQVDVDILKSSISVADFSLGDLISLKIQYGIYNIDETYRVFESIVKYDTDNTETLTLVLGTLNI